MRKFSLTLLLVLTVILVAACGTNANNGNSPAASPSQNAETGSGEQSSLDAIKAVFYLVFCTVLTVLQDYWKIVCPASSA
ncbi:hypothetical protein [Paenibacillus zanthoxyli]|uniref:hypothetical protein n=1 Tax=Paenibacillus zanthoxyli TaxID=369399 RepID=UPI000472B407|nr:hypothetical protein [Paenibacillus zanthoxyli]